MTDLKMTAKRVAELLSLARAVYPDKEWGCEDGWPCYWPYVNGATEVFDPANNSEQFVEVLAWLVRKTGRLELCASGNDDGEVDLIVYKRKNKWDTEDHDGTPADIRRAVVEAAIRVANA